MKGSSSSAPRLTEHERRALTLLIEGHSLKDVEATLSSPPRALERTVHRGLTKLEVWAQQTWPGDPHESALETGLGILTSREAERLINRRIVRSRHGWGCVALLALPDKENEEDIQHGAEEISRQLMTKLRHSDVVTKWHSSEWIVFVAGVNEAQLNVVLNRLTTIEAHPWPILLEAQAVTHPSTTFAEAATKCHQALMSRYAANGLSTLCARLARIPRKKPDSGHRH